MRQSMMGLSRVFVRSGCSAVMCVVLAGQPLLAVAASTKTPTAGQIQGDARVVHALNRLTFGPRPGDVAAVKAMGLDRWFEQQLNPRLIDDSALDARLVEFPAMRLEPAELMQRYPTPGTIRQMALGNQAPMPNDPVERAIYADQLAFYRMKLAVDAAGGKKGDGSGAQAAGRPMSGGNANASDDEMVKRGADALMMDSAGMKEQGTGTKDQTASGDPLAVAPKDHVAAFYPEQETQRVLAMAADARFREVLAMKPQDLIGFRRSLSKAELAALAMGMNAEQKETLQALGGSLKVIGSETLQSRMLRDVYSDRQLEAVMTDFWLNHFNVYVKKNQIEPYLIPSYEREVIRPLALGKFEDLLVATAQSPAMMVYLDNWQSIGPDSTASRRAAMRPQNLNQQKAPSGLNENYARELMELHTLGVGGGYTQADVTQVAKVFTGWTVEKPYQSGTFNFQENRHEPGSKTVLGKTISENGQREGLEVLHMLATSPATARFISTKLAVRFVSDDPPAALVDRMSAAFLASSGDMKVVLRTMFRSPEFWSPTVERAKVKTPEEFVISAVRASGAEVTNALPLVQALDKLGMPLYGMQTPNGYSWKEEGWVSTGALVSRMNFALVLSGDKIPGVRTTWPELLSEGGGMLATPVSAGGDSGEAAKERRLEMLLVGVPVSARTRATVLAQFNDEAMQGNAAKDFNLKGEDVVGGGGGKNGALRQRFPIGAEIAAGNNPGDAQAAGMAGLLLGSPEFQRR